MAVQNITTLKSFFQTGDIPTEAQYIDVFDTMFSFLKKDGSNADSDIDIGAYKMNAQSFHVKGTAGNGHIGLKFQSWDASASANETSIFANPSGNIKWKIDGGYYATFVSNGITADRVYTLKDASGTLAFTSDLTGGTVTSVSALAIATTGTDISSTVANSTTTPVITLNIPTASATNRGALSSSDWITFNNKQNDLGYTPENVSNKSTTTTLGTSDTLYPTQKAVKTYVDTVTDDLDYLLAYSFKATYNY